jgi:arachidonate 15-lipoxygenase (second type)/8-lipoxygenase (S-type)
MAKFRVRVSTGEAFGAGTWDKISVSIVGTRGETPPLPLDRLGKEFNAGAVSAWDVGVEVEEGAGGTTL